MNSWVKFPMKNFIIESDDSLTKNRQAIHPVWICSVRNLHNSIFNPSACIFSLRNLHNYIFNLVFAKQTINRILINKPQEIIINTNQSEIYPIKSSMKSSIHQVKASVKAQTIQHTKFTSNFPINHYPENHPQIIKIIFQRIWYFVIDTDWAQILPQIVKTQCEIFSPEQINSDSREPSDYPILILIASIHFTHFHSINLNSMRIYSIEGISFLNMENLQDLRLRDNLITCLKPFNKVNWPNLYTFFASNNRIKSFRIARTRTSKSMEWLYDDYITDDYQIQDPFCLMKIEAQQVKNMALIKKQNHGFIKKSLSKMRSRNFNRQVDKCINE